MYKDARLRDKDAPSARPAVTIVNGDPALKREVDPLRRFAIKGLPEKFSSHEPANDDSSIGSASPPMGLSRQRSATFGGDENPPKSSAPRLLQKMPSSAFPLKSPPQVRRAPAPAPASTAELDRSLKKKVKINSNDKVGQELIGELLTMISVSEEKEQSEDSKLSPKVLRRQISNKSLTSDPRKPAAKDKEREALKNKINQLLEKPPGSQKDISPPLSKSGPTRMNSARDFFGISKSSSKNDNPVNKSSPALALPPAPKPIKIFGSPLEDIMQAQRSKFAQHHVPFVLPLLTQALINCNGHMTEGIFRVPGKATEISRLKSQLDEWNFEIDTRDAHVLAGALKTWLRELPAPIVPTALYYECLKSIGEVAKSMMVLEKFPPLNKLIICFLTDFLRKFSDPLCEAKTLMGIDNISMVFAPGFMRCPSADPTEMMVNSELEKWFVKNLIEGTKENA